jgi:uncharacterized protein YoaH (UPF0181 family)
MTMASRAKVTHEQIQSAIKRVADAMARGPIQLHAVKNP